MRFFFTWLALILTLSCSGKTEYSYVFDHPTDEWSYRASRLDDEQLENVFIYGVVSVKPPVVLVDSTTSRSADFFDRLIDRAKKEQDDYVSHAVILTILSSDISQKANACDLVVFKHARLLANEIENLHIRNDATINLKKKCPRFSARS